MKKITNDLYYVGVNDHKIDLFEGHFPVQKGGMAYNSYIIVDNDIAIFDTTDQNFCDEWLSNVKEVLGNKLPKYLIVQHVEPDHSACIMKFLKEYPNTIVVGNALTFTFINQFFHEPINNKLIIKDGDKINLGKHELTFVFAAMVHWPEVFVTYDSYDKTLFSADGFGKFGALDYDDPEGWACEARRYYFGIVGKYGSQTQALLAKAKTLDIKRICALHGPILDKDLNYYFDLYDKWSKYEPEKDGTVILYTSVYGHTKKAVEYLADQLKVNGYDKFEVVDIAREDINECVENAFEYKNVILATTTYNMSIFPYMHDLLIMLTERFWQNRNVGIIENGTWVPNAANCIKTILKDSKNIRFFEPIVTIKSSMTEDNKKQLTELAKAIIKKD